MRSLSSLLLLYAGSTKAVSTVTGRDDALPVVVCAAVLVLGPALESFGFHDESELSSVSP